jgi:hypothetical protein
MSHGNKPSRSLIKEHASWFDLCKYDGLAGASEELWYRQFALRIDLQRMRSLLLPPELQDTPRYREVHGNLTYLIREKGIIDDRSLEIFLQLEEYLFPEAFSIFHAVSSDGLHVRPMTVGDQLRIALGLKPESVSQAQEAHNRDPYSVRQQSEPGARPSNILSEPLLDHLGRSSIGLGEAFLRVDLRFPRTLIKKQVEEIVDKLSAQMEMYLPQMKQTKLPATEAWIRSRVLPYIDLCQWLDEEPNHALRDQLLEADKAEALEIDPKQLHDTTFGHADELTDELSWTFLHLTEAAISSRRGPLTPLRKTKRKTKGREKN